MPPPTSWATLSVTDHLKLSQKATTSRAAMDNSWNGVTLPKTAP
eukprot:CAMPEP_0195035664 /NCGR_PEP_ID=MMETSP0326_2-20130528/70769_1 /TAXON_ID=2866 ORGANISM="Crypthecodinium cohnii, Strain Seligo" /NCGR_SAMPLE_ID=MMETSP0326_2 /ASSEMBLY_ACC=CAM_ASM_000348 /LENGTH=43 /DNA_ID= /DNA_START= /DNA_END= /DNA_ORIENTATION=